MKRLAISLALTCVLSASAMAVDMPTCGLTADETTTAQTTPGDIPSTDSASPGEMPGVDVSILLTVLELVF